MPGDVTTLLIIFFSRILDVSLGTMRIILISRGHKNIAPLLGFFEVLIWLTAISKALQNLNGIASTLVYAGGFAAGNYVGMLLEEWIPIGYQSIRVITKRKATRLPELLRKMGLGVTEIDGEGMEGQISLLYVVVAKKQVKPVLKAIKELHPKAFITIEDVRYYHSGFFAQKRFMDIFGKLVTKKK